jgi:magnesium transporter
MLVYRLDNHSLTLDESPHPDLNENNVYLMDFHELTDIHDQLGIGSRIVHECLDGDTSKFESHEGFDFITIDIPEAICQNCKPQRICIYFSSNLLVFITDRISFINDIVLTAQAEGVSLPGLSKFFQLFFDKLTDNDWDILTAIEEEVFNLEEEFIIAIKKNLADYLITFRRRLLILKQYYEQLYEISEAIEENENDLIDQRDLRYFKILTNRINRLFTNVLNLRDYGTQVREAYQAQMDINLNYVMKIFTVVTSVFLPLTLIVGWYGMNIAMPEFHWEYGYPFVIALSLTVATSTLVFFKKNKWF